MTTKFEQLLDLIVNEEMEKANELFHEIVVEKSKSIYENLIAQEAEEAESDDDSAVEENMDDVDESMDDDMDDVDESMDDSVEVEDAYSMEADDDMEPSGEEETDDLEGDVSMPDDKMDMDDSGREEDAMMDIKNAIQELEAAFAELEASNGGAAPEDNEFDDAPSDDMDDDGMSKEMMGMFEGKKRMTREYVEKVGNDWESKGSMKAQAKHVAAGTGDTEGGPVEGRSPIASGKNKPGPAGVNAKNLAQGASESAPDGTSPNGKAGGFLNTPKDMNTGNGNVPGGKMGVKNLKKVTDGHGAEKKGSAPGPVGSGTGDKAGQTSVNPVKQFLKPYTK